eukprot:TRINITY_DN15252_c0_g1_i1.p3 TRINITY_DN15252_c0_g1~~TRINITY_DN15252_c0_g1_i1.p3  ORF type:complete len:192 (+),score=25.64 TRINITY_DN15252_c0_g1_i1:42-578(+)
MSASIRNRRAIINTLQVARGLQRSGLTVDQAEKATNQIEEVLKQYQEDMSENYMTKIEVERLLFEQQSQTSQFRIEVTKDIERLSGQVDKNRQEIQYEVNKLSSSQRLDLNLEKGRMRDELQELREKTNALQIAFDREINRVKADMETSKNDTLKWVCGIVGALIVGGLTIARMFSAK